MKLALRPRLGVQRMLRVPAPPRSPRGYHVAVVTRCLIGLFFAVGCVSKPAYEQVSSAVEVEREAHRRTHDELLRKDARILELESQVQSALPAPTPTPLLSRSDAQEKEVEKVLKQREADLARERSRSRELEREKLVLTRSLSQKENELRALLDRECADGHDRDRTLDAAPLENRPPSEDAEAFVVDPVAPSALPAAPSRETLPSST